MSALNEILAAKKAALDEEGTAEGSAQGTTPAEQDKVEGEVIATTEISEAATYMPPTGSYRNLRCHSVITSKGVCYKPNKFGFYDSFPEEHRSYFDYYAEKGLLELVE